MVFENIEYQNVLSPCGTVVSAGRNKGVLREEEGAERGFGDVVIVFSVLGD